MQNEYKSKRDRDTAEALEKKKKSEAYLDKIRGCLIGGGAGDALGYPVWKSPTISATAARLTNTATTKIPSGRASIAAA